MLKTSKNSYGDTVMNDNLGILLRSQGILNRWRNAMQLNAGDEQQQKERQGDAQRDDAKNEKDRAQSEYVAHRLAELAKWEKRISGKG
jgi:hypothetical protein